MVQLAIRITGVLAVAVVLLTICMPACAEDADEGEIPREWYWDARADAAWPPGEVVKGYRRAYELHNAKRTQTALRLAAELSTRPLRLAPDSVLWDERYYEEYTAGRVMDTIARMRDICRHNEGRSADFSKAGLRKAALEALSVNVSMASQLAHSEPHDAKQLIVAARMWQSAWKSVSAEMAAACDKEGADAAAACCERGRAFVAVHLKPEVEEYGRRVDELMEAAEDDVDIRASLEVERERLPKLRELVALWDKEVEDASCKALIANMQREE